MAIKIKTCSLIFKSESALIFFKNESFFLVFPLVSDSYHLFF